MHFKIVFTGYSVRYQDASLSTLDNSVESLVRVVFDTLDQTNQRTKKFMSSTSADSPKGQTNGVIPGLLLGSFDSVIISVAELPEVKDSTWHLTPAPLPVGALFDGVLCTGSYHDNVH